MTLAELKEYKKELAKVAVHHGINLEPGRFVYVITPIEQEELAYYIAEECYKMGARRVEFKWISEPINHLKEKNASEADLGTLYSYERAMLEFLNRDLSPRIVILSDYFTDKSDLDLDKITSARQKIMKEYVKFRETADAYASWCAIPAPNPKWAHKLFPNIKDDDEAMLKAWELFFRVTRIKPQKGLRNWRLHDIELSRRTAWLNSLDIDTLHYTSKNGTDFTVGLIPNYKFVGGSTINLATHRRFNPNFPTEECFTAPKKGVAEGIVYASKPLIYNGVSIRDFYFRFHEGKIVEAHARKNEKLLNELIDSDKNSRYLGEVALVPFNSPINMSGKLFYHTLFDENAVCHLAFGMSFPFNYRFFNKQDPKFLEQKVGLNTSRIHIDFMIGTSDLNIVAKTHSGREIVIFRNGTWAK